MTYGILDKPPLDDLYSKSFSEEEKETIEHGWLKDQAAKVHKYIKRWKSKSGKWVYQYEKKVKEKASEYAEKGKNTKLYKEIKRKISDRNYKKSKDKSKALYSKDSRFNRSEDKDILEQKGKLYKNQSGKRFKYVGRVKTPYGYRYFYDQKEYDKYMARYKNLIKQDDDEYIQDLNLKTLTKPETVNESVKNVNPKYDDGTNLPYAINCQRCCLAFEMRQRGFDVEAGANASGFDPLDSRYHPEVNNLVSIHNYFDGVNDPTGTFYGREYEKWKALETNNKYNNPDRIWFEKKMESMPNDSRGIITVEWIGYNSGHALNWVKDSRGVVSIVDSQIGKIYTPEEFYEKRDIAAGDTEIFRTDNLEINPKFKYYYAMDNSEDDIFLNRGKGA